MIEEIYKRVKLRTCVIQFGDNKLYELKVVERKKEKTNLVVMVRMMGWEAPKLGLRKGPWTPEEDKLLAEYVGLHGEGRWSSVAKSTGLNRSGKSCRLRWVNYLRPGLKRGHLTPQEEGIIIELHALWGNKWSTIARYLPGRTDNYIKNYWRTHFKKRPEKSSLKQQKRKAQILKLKLEQQQEEEEKPDHKKDEIKTEEAGDHGKANSQAVEITDQISQGTQEMVFMYPTPEDQCLSQEPDFYSADTASWMDDQYLVDEGLSGGWWSLDDDQAAGFCNMFAMQNQENTGSYNYFGGDASNGGYIF